MKYLFVIHSYFPYEDANTNCLMPIVNKLKEDNEVIILANGQKSRYSQPSIENEIQVYRYKKRFDTKVLSFLVKGRKHIKSSQLFYNWLIRIICWLLLMLSFPYIAFYRYAYKTKIYTDEYVCMQYIKKIINEKGINILITISAPSYPHYSALSLAKSKYSKKRGIKWLAYFMDPDATYMMVPPENRLPKVMQEKQIYQYTDLILLPPEMYKENITNEFQEFVHKMVELKFANLKPIINNGNYSDLLKEKFIECAYIGSLNDERIRNPKGLLNLIKNIDNNNFRFHLIGVISDRILSEIVKIKQINDLRVVIHGKCSLDKCYFFIKNANLLINIGNNCTNQMPSKVFDYIASGKPIVNFYAIENDTSKSYLSEYPLCLNLENSLDSSVLVNKFVKFGLINKNKHIDYKFIRQKYSLNLSENVVETLEKTINDHIYLNDRR